MFVYKIRNIQEFFDYRDKTDVVRSHCRDLEASITPRWQRPFWLKGWSYPARKQVYFYVAHKRSDCKQINWREQLRCPVTKLNNRMRAAIHLFDMECGPYPHDKIYLSEQVTSLFKVASGRYANVTGSEYLGESVALGNETTHGIRNEDLTQLSFPSASYDHMLSFDCLEHIPDYSQSISEIHRILKPGGKFVLSVPFECSAEKNLQRARLLADGTIEHLLSPEYHGDPLGRDGCLSYWVFGWEILDEMRDVGFSDVYAVIYWSRSFGYLGNNQILFIAKK